jgi:hypothetical protein
VLNTVDFHSEVLSHWEGIDICRNEWRMFTTIHFTVTRFQSQFPATKSRVPLTDHLIDGKLAAIIFKPTKK